jgi:hypothetical protein
MAAASQFPFDPAQTVSPPAIREFNQDARPLARTSISDRNSLQPKRTFPRLEEPTTDRVD